ncbi:hypothetical protein AB4476_19825 [Vibrio splendidus]
MTTISKFSIESKAFATNDPQAIEFAKLCMGEFTINDKHRTLMADRLVDEFIASPFDFNKQKPNSVAKSIRAFVKGFEDGRLDQYTEGRLSFAKTVVGMHLERIAIIDYIEKALLGGRVARLNVNAKKHKLLRHYLESCFREGYTATNILDIESAFQKIRSSLSTSYPAMDSDLEKALRGLTETELQIIWGCIVQKNSHDSEVKGIPIGQASLKYFTRLLSSEICKFGSNSIMNQFGSHNTYFKIRNAVADELGFDIKKSDKRSQFLLNFNVQNRVKKRNQFLKGMATFGFSSTEPALVLLSHIVPIIERSYQYSSTTCFKFPNIVKETAEETDQAVERLMPWLGETVFPTDSSFDVRVLFNSKFETPVFKEGDNLGGMRELESLWEEAIKHPNQKYSDVAAFIIGTGKGEEAAEEAVINIETLREAKETLRSQIAGELTGNRARGNVSAEQYKGDIFERLNVIFFNKNAKLQGKDVRAFTTDDLGLRNHQCIDIVVLDLKDKAKFDSFESMADKEAFIELRVDKTGAGWQAKCNNDATTNINSLSKYQGVGFIGNFSKEEIANALGRKNISDHEFQAFLDNYNNTVKSYGIKGDKFTAEDAATIAASPEGYLSEEAQAVLNKHINDQIENLGKEVVNACVQAALIGGVVSAFVEALQCQKEGVPLSKAVKRIGKAGLEGAVKSAMRGALVTFVTAHAKRYAAQKAMGGIAAKAVGRGAGVVAVFAIESAWDLYKYYNGDIQGKELAEKVGNNAMGAGAALGIIMTIGTGGTGIVLGVVVGGIVSIMNPTGRLLLTDYESVLKHDPVRQKVPIKATVVM